MTQRLIVASSECVSFLSKFGLKFIIFSLKCRQPVVHELGEWSEYILRFTKIVGNRRMQRYTSCILQNRPNEGCKSKTAAIRILPFETSFDRALRHRILNMKTYWCVLPFEKHPLCMLLFALLWQLCKAKFLCPHDWLNIFNACTLLVKLLITFSRYENNRKTKPKPRKNRT